MRRALCYSFCDEDSNLNRSQFLVYLDALNIASLDPPNEINDRPHATTIQSIPIGNPISTESGTDLEEVSKIAIKGTETSQTITDLEEHTLVDEKQPIVDESSSEIPVGCSYNSVSNMPNQAEELSTSTLKSPGVSLFQETSINLGEEPPTKSINYGAGTHSENLVTSAETAEHKNAKRSPFQNAKSSIGQSSSTSEN